MERKICTHCILEENIEDFHNKYTEYKFCSSKRSLKIYHENKDEISNQRKIYYENK